MNKTWAEEMVYKYHKEIQKLAKERNQLKQQLKEKDNKIQVLEKQRNNYRHKRNEYRKQLKPIKQQLAESEEQLKSSWYEICPRCGNPYGASQFVRENGEVICSNCMKIEEIYEPLINQLEDQNDRLINERDNAILQLAEKAEFLKKQKELFETVDRELYLTKDTLKHHTNIYNSLVESRYQDKISFAVEQLEWLKNKIPLMSVQEIIDGKIWELTHQHEGKGE